jgi:N-acetylmuramoyl-L-alanine amidase
MNKIIRVITCAVACILLSSNQNLSLASEPAFLQDESLALQEQNFVPLETVTPGETTGPEQMPCPQPAQCPPAKAAGESTSLKLKNVTVVLDPGHGGEDRGAVRKEGDKTIEEAKLTLAIALKAKQKLVAEGATVKMTREEDSTVSLQDRVAFATKAKAESKHPDKVYFVSVHINSLSQDSSEKVFGIEVYSSNTQGSGMSGYSRKLAQDIHAALIAASGATARGVKQANHHVTRNATMPAILGEMGFITHPAERKNLIDSAYQEKLGTGICNGVIAFNDNPVPAQVFAKNKKHSGKHTGNRSKRHGKRHSKRGSKKQRKNQTKQSRQNLTAAKAKARVTIKVKTSVKKPDKGALKK